MNILFINTGPWGTGSFTVIKGLAKEMLKLGHKVKILFPDAHFASVDLDEYYKNQDLYHIWEFPIKNASTTLRTFPLMITDPHPRNPTPLTFKDLSREQLALYEQALANEILKLNDTFRPDIIECHHIWLASWTCHKLGLDYVVMAHHSDQLGFKYYPEIQKKAIASAQGAHKIFAISKSVKKEILRLYHVDFSKIYLSKNGYDKETFKPFIINKETVLKALNLDIPLGVPIISFAGKLSRTKGMDLLMRANKELNSKREIHTIVMGAGEIAEITKKLEEGSYSLKNMHFVGHQTPEMVANIHNICNVGVMPSRSEGFGIACLEAMACGLPMVVSKSGGPETFAIGKIIDKGSSDQLAQSILEILDLPESQYLDLCQEAIKAAEKFSWKKIAEKHLEIYSDIIKTRGTQRQVS